MSIPVKHGCRFKERCLQKVKLVAWVQLIPTFAVHSIMTDLKEILKPVSGNHSIKEAVITLFLVSPIIKPERFEALINTSLKETFQKFEKVSQVQFQFRGKEEGYIESTPPLVQENVGFRFQRFEEGKMVVVLQGMNENLRNFLSYHSLNYSHWNKFLPDFKRVISEVAIFHQNLFVNAFSLHYIDEFEWVGGPEIDTKRIFNQESSLLPKEFFNCKLNNYQFITVKKNKFEYFDRVEIKVEERPKTFITISHNVIQNFNEIFLLNDLISSNEMKEMLDLAHDHNKNTLTNILTKEVSKLIYLLI